MSTGSGSPEGRAGLEGLTPAAPGLKGGGGHHGHSHGAVRPTGPATAPQADYWGHTPSYGRKEETGGVSVGWMCVWMLVCGLGVWALAE